MSTDPFIETLTRHKPKTGWPSLVSCTCSPLSPPFRSWAEWAEHVAEELRCGKEFERGEVCVLPPHGGEFHVHHRGDADAGEIVVSGPCEDGGDEGCTCPKGVYFSTVWPVEEAALDPVIDAILGGAPTLFVDDEAVGTDG